MATRKKIYKRPRIASRGVTKKVKPVPLLLTERDPYYLIDRLELVIGRLVAVVTVLEALHHGSDELGGERRDERVPRGAQLPHSAG